MSTVRTGPAPTSVSASGADSSQDRFGRRRRRIRLGRWRHRLVILLVVALVAAAGWLLGWSSVLALESVDVRTTSPAVARQVEDAVTGSGLTPVGEPLARVDTGAVEELVAGLAPVAEVRVRRGWPTTLVVDVVERTAAAVIRDGEVHRLVDRSGVVFRTVMARPTSLPLLEGSADPAAAPVRAAALQVLASLPGDLRPRVVKISARTIDDIRLSLRAPGRDDDVVTVVWGGVDRSPRKSEVLSVLLDQEAEVYDVSAPDLPTIRVSS